MMAFRSRLTKTISVLACALCAARRGQCLGSGSRYRSAEWWEVSNRRRALVDALSTPHWNGWGVDASQHRFQPSEMAQLAAG